MRKINIGLIGYGVVGNGVIKLLQKRKSYLRAKFGIDFEIKTLCDRSVHKKDTKHLEKTTLTTNFQDILEDKEIDVVIELIGGINPAKEIVFSALKKGKHVITANKELIANHGQEIFELAKQVKKFFYFESSVGAGIPIIKTLTEGMVGNKCTRIFGIINGTSNFILTEMTKNKLTFSQALEEAQRKGFAESDPTLDINGMDSAHKLAILVHLALGKFIKVKDIYTEGITQISHDDIEHAESLNLTIKLLAIAKKVEDQIEARVHPTLISKDHPLASINDIYNAFYLKFDPVGDILLSGEGAGQMTAASGVVSDLINLSIKQEGETLLCDLNDEAPNLTVRAIDHIQTRFYIRFMATDKPGVLSKISGILGEYNIGINSVAQKAHNRALHVPLVILTDYTTEEMLRLAFNAMKELPIIKGKPVAIRMENLS